MAAIREWTERIKEATNGQVIITIYASSSLVGEQDMMPATEKGLTDIGSMNISADIEKYPLSPILQLPFLPLGDWRAAYQLWMDLEDKHPELKAEYSECKKLCQTVTGGMGLHSIEKVGVIRTPDDLKGVKIFAGGNMAQVMGEIGASPMFLQLPDWYSSLERGLMEAMWMNWPPLIGTGIHELLVNNMIFPSGVQATMSQMIMSWDKWNKLPPSAQKAFDDNYYWVTERWCEIGDKSTEETLAFLREEGHTVVTLTKEEQHLWYEASQNVYEEYLNGLEAKGLPGRAIYEDMISMLGE
jgi:TRAP-type C4-dicarboxylate transport system substrate-binding protein